MTPSEVINFLREIQNDYGIPPEVANDDDPEVVFWEHCHDAIECVYRLWSDSDNEQAH
jgi:hypothetical protein